jgi:hypothetical protein
MLNKMQGFLQNNLGKTTSPIVLTQSYKINHFDHAISKKTLQY